MRNRFLAAVVVCLLCGPFLFSQSVYEKLQGWCQNGGINLTTNGAKTSEWAQRSYGPCTVTVYGAGTTTPLSAIFSDAAGSVAKANPFTAAASGQWWFYAAPGRYDVRFSGSGITTPFTLGDFSLHTGIGYITSPCMDARVYGVHGDGTSDDTTHLQNAINSIGATGGKICLPAGSYRTTATLTVPYNISIEGQGRDNTIIYTDFTTGPAIQTTGSAGDGSYLFNHFRIDSYHIVTGTHNGSANSASLVDTTKNFTTLGVVVGDSLSNETDTECWGTVSGIATTTNPNDTLNVTALTWGNGGERDFDAGDTYVVRRNRIGATSNGILNTTAAQMEDLFIEYQNNGIVIQMAGTHAREIMSQHNTGNGVKMVTPCHETYLDNVQSHQNMADGFYVDSSGANNYNVGLYFTRCGAASNMGAGWHFYGDTVAINIENSGTAHNFCGDVSGFTTTSPSGETLGQHNVHFEAWTTKIATTVTLTSDWFESVGTRNNAGASFSSDNIHWDDAGTTDSDIVITGCSLQKPGRVGLYIPKAERVNITGTTIIGGNDKAAAAGLRSAMYLDGYHITLNGVVTRNTLWGPRGDHDGANDATILTDATYNFGYYGIYVGALLKNLTDGSEGVISILPLTGDTHLHATLTGGAENDWDFGDEFEIVLNHEYGINWGSNTHHVNIVGGNIVGETDVYTGYIPIESTVIGVEDFREKGQTMSVPDRMGTNNTHIMGGTVKPDRIIMGTTFADPYMNEVDIRLGDNIGFNIQPDDYIHQSCYITYIDGNAII